MLCEWGHERGSFFPVSGLKVEVTPYKIRGAQPILPLLFCFWSCLAQNDWKYSILANDLRGKVWDANIISEYIFLFPSSFPPSREELIFMEASTSMFCTNFWLWAVEIFVTEIYFTRKIPTNSNVDLLEDSNRTPILSGIPSTNIKVESLKHVFSNIFSYLRKRIHISHCLLSCFYK